jgi:DNA-binding transcriptional MocR family regulator
MTGRVSRRIGAISESATLAVDGKAKALKAAGRPVVGFGAGEPDFPTPDYIVEAAAAACREPRWHRYSPAGGLPDLREAVAAKTERDSGYEVSAAQVMITNGGKQAVYEGFAALLDPGDEVIVLRTKFHRGAESEDRVATPGLPPFEALEQERRVPAVQFRKGADGRVVVGEDLPRDRN